MGYSDRRRRKYSRRVVGFEALEPRTLLAVVSHLNATAAFNPQDSWARAAGGRDRDFLADVSTLSDGSAIVTGVFSGTASFGSTTLISSGNSDIFVAKLDPAGNYVWAKRAGGSSGDGGNSVSVLPDGSALVTGYFSGTASFGSKTLTASGSAVWQDVFVAKIDPAGTFVWASRAGGATSDSGNDISAFPDGTAIVTGFFSGTASFGSKTLTSSNFDAFVAKLDAAGSFVWATKAGGTDMDSGGSVSTLPDGSAIVTGNFGRTASFGAQSLTSSGDIDMFIAKVDAAGNYRWVTKAGGAGLDFGGPVSTFSDGSAIVMGAFSGTASFGPKTLTTSDGNKSVVAKIDPAGKFAWVTRLGTGLVSGGSVSTLADGSVIITGHFSGTASFGAETLVSSGEYDMFVTKIDSAGNFIWANKAGGTSTDTGNAVSVLSDGSAILAGSFSGTASFGPTTLTANGGYDAFVARINANGSWVKPSLPAGPTDVVATLGSNVVSLAWTAPAANGGSAITDYVVQCSNDAGVSWQTFPDGSSTATTATVTGLTNGTSYVFRVAAVNAAGTGGWSVNTAAVTPRTVPAIPTNVIGIPGKSQASLSWTPPADDGGNLITDYAIQYSSDGGSSWLSFPHSPSTATVTTVTGLANGTSYVFRVAAVNSFGTGTYSPNSATLTPVAPVTKPGVPTAVAGTPSNTQVSLTWTAPASDGGSPITNYEIMVAEQTSGVWSSYRPVTRAASAATTAVVSGLTNGKIHIFVVRAVNAVGVSPWVTLSQTVTPKAAGPSVISNLSAIAGNQQVSLSWSAPSSDGGSPITNYEIMVAEQTSGVWSSYRPVTRAASAATTAVVSGLTNGKIHIFVVRAVNAVGVSPWVTLPSPAKTVLDQFGTRMEYREGDWSGVWLRRDQSNLWDCTMSKPHGETVTYVATVVVRSTQVEVMLDEIMHSELGRGAAHERRGTLSKDGRTIWFGEGGTGGRTHPGEDYFVRAFGTRPGAPTNLTATPGNQLVSLNWTAPASDGGAAITNYEIMVAEQTSGVWSSYRPVTRAASAATTAVVSGLTAGKVHIFVVRAVNAVGVSPWVTLSRVVSPLA